MTDTINFPELAETIRKNMEPGQFEAERGSFEKADYAVIPAGMEIKSLKPILDEYRTKPDRRTGTAKVDTILSFIDLTNRLSSEESAVFARAQVTDTTITASLTAVLNYHPVGGDNTKADFADHRIVYDFPVSKDFAAWLKKNGSAMTQLDFAQFLEDRLHDIAAPHAEDKKSVEGLTPKFADAVEIVALSRDLELYSAETFKSKQRLASGETEFRFTSQHVDAGGKPVVLPDFFVIQLPLFEGGAPERVLVRLRYRLKDGAVVWWFELYRVDRSLDAAFQSACRQIIEETSLSLYVGAPESTR